MCPRSAHGRREPRSKKGAIRRPWAGDVPDDPHGPVPMASAVRPNARSRAAVSPPLTGRWTHLNRAGGTEPR